MKTKLILLIVMVGCALAQAQEIDVLPTTVEKTVETTTTETVTKMQPKFLTVDFSTRQVHMEFAGVEKPMDIAMSQAEFDGFMVGFKKYMGPLLQAKVPAYYNPVATPTPTPAP